MRLRQFSLFEGGAAPSSGGKSEDDDARYSHYIRWEDDGFELSYNAGIVRFIALPLSWLKSAAHESVCRLNEISINERQVHRASRSCIHGL